MLAALGLLIAVLGGLMFLPAAIDLAFVDEDWHAFASAGVISIGFGVAVFLAMRGEKQAWSSRQSILFVNALWVSVSFFASLPLYLSSLHLSFADAVFETVSGLTTTGSTILTGLDNLAPGLLFWRSMLQWIGGLGIVAIGVTLLPSLGFGGQKLFYLESSEQNANPFPRIRQFAARIVFVYVGLTLGCAVAYFVLGMTGFEALNHSMTTVSTGGFSTSDESIGHFHSLGILLVASLFMFIGGLPFLYLVRFFSPDRPEDPQIELYVKGVLAATLVVYLAKEILRPDAGFDDLVLSLFNVISIVTTTGYAAGDYQLWGPLFWVIFLGLTFFGACSGSTSGGLKQFRFVVAWTVIKQAVAKGVHPNRVQPSRYGNQGLSNEVASATLSLIFLFFATFGLFAILLEFSGLDFITSISASATALANVGPGLGEVIGPAGNFTSLPVVDKWLLSVEMILGRLEILSGYALLMPAFWRW